MKKATIPEEKRSQSHGKFSTNAPCKNSRILSHFLTGATLNRFEAEKLGDHCLNSTISTLKNTHGLNIHRQWEKVSNRWGAPCHVRRYQLLDADKEQAARVLAQLLGRTPPSEL